MTPISFFTVKQDCLKVDTNPALFLNPTSMCEFCHVPFFSIPVVIVPVPPLSVTAILIFFYPHGDRAGSSALTAIFLLSQ